KRVITFAKRAHSDTAIGEHAVSISYAAVERAKTLFGKMDDKRIVVLGAGETAELALKNFHSSGAAHMTVVNRSFENARRLAEKFNAAALQLDQLADALIDADIFISATAAAETILSQETFQPVQTKRGNKP